MTTRAEQRKRNNRIRRKKRIIATLRFIIIVVAIYSFIFYTPFFKVKNISVEGANASSTESVISASGILSGQHMLKIDKKEAAAQIEKLAYVKSATIKRIFPNKVKILILEGKVCANIAIPEGFAAIDESGKVMEIGDSPKVTPAVYGLAIKKSEVGEKLTIDEPDKFDIILEYVNQLNLQALPIPCVSITLDSADVWIELENGVLAYFGNDEDIEYKVAAFAESLRSAGDITTGYFDVSTPERIIYSTSSPFEEEQAETEENTENEDEPSSEE